MSGKYGSPAFEILIGRFKFQTRQVISLSRSLQWAFHEASYLSNKTWNLNAVEHPSFQTEQYFSSQLLWCSSSTYTWHLYLRGHLKSNQINFIFDCTFRHSTEKPWSLAYRMGTNSNPACGMKTLLRKGNQLKRKFSSIWNTAQICLLEILESNLPYCGGCSGLTSKLVSNHKSNNENQKKKKQNKKWT